MQVLKRFVGKEHRLDEVSAALRDWVRALNPGGVGAHQINCSDECERECVESFHNTVVRPLLPELKYWSSSSFRTVNLGARYECGSIGIAEEHYATTKAKQGFKVLLVKLNTHVSVVGAMGKPLVFGRMDRYDRESVYCGALHALLDDAPGQYVDALRETFQTGMDRLSVLRDKAQVEPRVRALYAAVVAAQLQSVRAVSDVFDHESHSKTVYLIVPAVTINRHDDDTEVVVGLHLIDERGEKRTHAYFGLGSDPARYLMEPFSGRFQIKQR